MALSAVDTIHRGLVNLRGNWELVFVQFLQTSIGTILLLVGFVPPLAVLGFTNLEVFESTGEDWAALMDGATSLLSRGREAWVLLLASIVLSSVIWLMAMLVHCYFQAGIYGVLTAGDRQAAPGKPRGWRWFRTFSVRNLRGWGAQFLWRYFWLLNLFLAISTLWLVFPLVFVLLAVWGEAQWGSTAAFGIGCGGMVLFLFTGFVLAFWFSLAQADLARDESSVVQATKQGLLVLSQRLGAVILIALLLMIVSVSMGLGILIISAFGNLGLGSSFALQFGWQMALNLIQWLLSCIIGVAFAAISISLVRAEVSQGVEA